MTEFTPDQIEAIESAIKKYSLKHDEDTLGVICAEKVIAELTKDKWVPEIGQIVYFTKTNLPATWAKVHLGQLKTASYRPLNQTEVGPDWIPRIDPNKRSYGAVDVREYEKLESALKLAIEGLEEIQKDSYYDTLCNKHARSAIEQINSMVGKE